MKKSIVVLSLFIVSVFGLMLQSCTSPEPENIKVEVVAEKTIEPEGVHVYYFHSTRRCSTCKAVENVTVEAITEYFNGDISFESINMEEDKDNSLLKKYEVTGQTLLVINDDSVIDLTSDAFMMARIKPKEFKSLVKSTIENLQ